MTHATRGLAAALVAAALAGCAGPATTTAGPSPTGSPSPAGEGATEAAPTAPPPTAVPRPSADGGPSVPAGTTLDRTIGTRPARLADQQVEPVVAPVRLRVPRLGIDAEVVPVGVDDGTGLMAVPADPHTVAWYRHGASPGERGSAVLAGHVDYAGELGVFARLDELAPGDRVEVELADGSAERFTIGEPTVRVPKAELPVGELFARDGAPTLRLVTCGGAFDPVAHHYLDNTIAVARPA